MIKQAAGVLIIQHGLVLGFKHLSKHTGSIGVPGGKLEGNETAAEAAIRECLEETGYFVELLDLEPYVEISTNGLFIMHVYKAKVAAITEPEYPEEGTPIWITPSRLAEDAYFGAFNTKMLQHFGIL
jgi:8-oxo-dGTP diphosphatase